LLSKQQMAVVAYFVLASVAKCFESN